MCWCSPIAAVFQNPIDPDGETGDVSSNAVQQSETDESQPFSRHFANSHEMSQIVDQYLLFLPRLKNVGSWKKPEYKLLNSYYVVGHKWTERVQTGEFIRPQLSPELFRDWITT